MLRPPSTPLVLIRQRGSYKFSRISKFARWKAENPSRGGWLLRWAGGLLCRSGRGKGEVAGSEHHGGLQKRSGFWVEKAEVSD